MSRKHVAFDTDTDKQIHELEKRLMTFPSRGDILSLIDIQRSYRRAIREIAASRYSDGECDSATLHSIISEVEQAEGDLLARLEGEHHFTVGVAR